MYGFKGILQLGITKDILDRLIEATEPGIRGVRDRALLLVAYDTLCRRSELVFLRIEDIESINKNNSTHTNLFLRKTKQIKMRLVKNYLLAIEQISHSKSGWVSSIKLAAHYLEELIEAKKLLAVLGKGKSTASTKELPKRQN